LTKKTAEDPES